MQKRIIWGVWLLAGLSAVQASEMQPGVLVADAQITSGLVRRGERLGPLGAVGSLYFNQTLNDRLNFHANASAYVQFDRGTDFGEALYDLGLTWHHPALGPARLAAGWLYSDRNNSITSPAYLGRDSQEFYVGADFEVPLSPWVYWYYDYDRSGGRRSDQVGSYVNTGVTRQFALGNAWTLDLSGRLGFDFGRGVDFFSDALIRTRFRYQIDEHISFEPKIDWWFPSHQVDPGAGGFRPVLSLGLNYQTNY